MNTYLVLLRGVNVGGKNKVPMAVLRERLEQLGFEGVSTYIASGNAIVRSHMSAAEVADSIERELPRAFALDDELIKVLVLTREQVERVIDERPAGFGDSPDTYYSDAIFLIGIDTDDAMAVFRPREGVDAVWPGPGVVYSQRVSALRTKSRLSAVMASPLYKSMTIRSWQTTLKLAKLLRDR